MARHCNTLLIGMLMVGMAIQKCSGDEKPAPLSIVNPPYMELELPAGPPLSAAPERLPVLSAGQLLTFCIGPDGRLYQQSRASKQIITLNQPQSGIELWSFFCRSGAVLHSVEVVL